MPCARRSRRAWQVCTDDLIMLHTCYYSWPWSTYTFSADTACWTVDILGNSVPIYLSIYVCPHIFAAANGYRLMVYVIYFPAHCAGVTNVSPYYRLSPMWITLVFIGVWDLAAQAIKNYRLVFWFGWCHVPKMTLRSPRRLFVLCCLAVCDNLEP